MMINIDLFLKNTFDPLLIAHIEFTINPLIHPFRTSGWTARGTGCTWRVYSRPRTSRDSFPRRPGCSCRSTSRTRTSWGRSTEYHLLSGPPPSQVRIPLAVVFHCMTVMAAVLLYQTVVSSIFVEYQFLLILLLNWSMKGNVYWSAPSSNMNLWS